jgi:cell division protease FtsH
MPPRQDGGPGSGWGGGPGTGPGGGPGGGSPPGGGRRFARLWWLLIAVLAINWIIVLSTSRPTNRLTVPYTFFRQEVVAGNVSQVTTRGDQIQGDFKRAVTYPPRSTTTERAFQTQVPTLPDAQILPLLIKKGVTVSAKPAEGRSVWLTLLLGFGPTLIFIGLLFFLFRRIASGVSMGGGGLAGFGRSRARRYEASSQRTTFTDVAGIDEAESELIEIVDFLRRPDRYRRLGGAIPRGVLLSGPPGTGKTLLARAVAGEADVPFYSLSASEFVEMIVGVGASRVRDLFEQARRSAPAIVFIDELDAIGRQRGAAGSIGGHDEREQTLNQILTEMDGFDGSEGVIVIGATNRPEVLDPALLRPGRFDRRIAIHPPDLAGRKAILQVHTRHTPLGPDVDLGEIAASTPGMVGADLRNLVNEAALSAARHDQDVVRAVDFSAALERIVLGAERKMMISPDERERTAYHESGHALLGMLQPGADPVRKISIVPRGRALGVTLQRPEADRYGFSSGYLFGRIIGALGGRAAEELIYGDVTTGAENDLDQVTQLARRMVGRWGMSDAIGPVSVLPADGGDGLPAAAGLPETQQPSDRMLELVDAEVRRIIEDCYGRALEQLRDHRDALDRLAHRLLERETLDEEEAYEIAGIPRRARQPQPESVTLGERSATAPPEGGG